MFRINVNRTRRHSLTRSKRTFEKSSNDCQRVERNPNNSAVPIKRVFLFFFSFCFARQVPWIREWKNSHSRSSSYSFSHFQHFIILSHFFLSQDWHLWGFSLHHDFLTKPVIGGGPTGLLAIGAVGSNPAVGLVTPGGAWSGLEAPDIVASEGDDDIRSIVIVCGGNCASAWIPFPP